MYYHVDKMVHTHLDGMVHNESNHTCAKLLWQDRLYLVESIAKCPAMECFSLMMGLLRPRILTTINPYPLVQIHLPRRGHWKNNSHRSNLISSFLTALDAEVFCIAPDSHSEDGPAVKVYMKHREQNVMDVLRLVKA